MAEGHCEMIVRCLSSSVISQQKFLGMMHPLIPGANVEPQRYSKTNNIGNILSKMGEVLHFFCHPDSLTHSHISMTLWLHFLKDTVMRVLKGERFPHSSILI